MNEEQRAILDRMRKGHILKANFEVEKGHWGNPSFFWFYSPVQLEHDAHPGLVEAHDVEFLQRTGCIKVDSLEKGGLAASNQRVWRNWTANYTLMEAGKQEGYARGKKA